MPVITLAPSDSPTVIFSLLRLSAHHLALAVSELQPLKSGTLSLHLSVSVPVLKPFVVTSRPTTASRPSTPLNPSPLVPQKIRLCWPLCAFINHIYLLTYLLHSVQLNWTELNCSSSTPVREPNAASWRRRAWPITRRVNGSTWCRSVQFCSVRRYEHRLRRILLW